MRRPKTLNQIFLKASRAMGMRGLLNATRVIQRTLLNPVAGPDFSPLFRPLKAPARLRRATPKTAKAPRPSVRAASPPVAADPAPVEDLQVADAAVVAEPMVAKPRKASFSERVFTFNGERFPYRLFIPVPPAASDANSDASQAPMPLVVLLHGCKQDAQDFARGTAMNALAGLQGCMVLYPEQSPRSNPQRCWNWFEPGHQQLDEGEPGMIAALTQQVLAHDYNGQRADPERVYIAGLSAGGAMAAVVAGLYPHIFAAVGVHSGLPSGAAQDLMSAFGAMRRGARGQATPAMPTIVFHGSGDTTVHPDNGDHISAAALAALKAAGLPLVKSRSTVGAATQETSTEKTVYRVPDGPTYVEHWRIDAGPHAWSGGDAAGSYTDPDGPSASAAMLSFFLQHKLKA
ncbi:MAG: PHB depolymerase family esterase [Pseudomonadota bacterium]